MTLTLLKKSEIKALREVILNEQGGACMLCERILKAEDRPCLDHDHTSEKRGGKGLVRGVLCNKCNVALGKCERGAAWSPVPEKFMQNLLGYVNSKPYNIVHPFFKTREQKIEAHKARIRRRRERAARRR